MDDKTAKMIQALEDKLAALRESEEALQAELRAIKGDAAAASTPARQTPPPAPLPDKTATACETPRSAFRIEGDTIVEYTATLKDVVIPRGITKIANGAFKDCVGLTSVTIGDSVTSIGDGAFSGCTGLMSITIGSGVTSIGKSLFDGCSSLKSISIRENNLSYCSINNCIIAQKTKILLYVANDSVIPEDFGVTAIGASAFYGRAGLTSITIPNSVTDIGYGAFSGCTGLKSVTIPDSVTSIGDYAFRGCTGLTSITIPDSVMSIPEGLFSGCSSLESITIPFVGESKKSSKDTNQYPFGYIFGENRYTGAMGTYQEYYKYSTISTTRTTYYIPSTLKSVTVTGGNILYGAFSGCSRLTSITIGNGVKSIESGSFSGCSELTSVTIGSGVTSIGNDAFWGCTRLTSVTIGNSVTSIGNYAFNGCTGLTSVTIPNSVMSIGEHAFSGCKGLTSITIPDSVTSIGDSAFSCCFGLTKITIPVSVTSIGDDAFLYISKTCEVFYAGIKKQWKQIKIPRSAGLHKLKIHFTD